MSNTVSLKQNNMLRLLQAVYTSESATKPELSRLTGLTMPTVHNFISELETAQIVLANGATSSQGGRPAVKYEFNESLFHLIGVRMKLDALDIGLFDLKLRGLQQKHIPVAFSDMTSEEGQRAIVQHVKAAMEQWRQTGRQLLGVGVTFPGPVDVERGLILELPNLRHWKGVPAKATLERALDVPIVVEKDSLSNVLALKWLGEVQTSTNVVYMVIEKGVGIGLLNEGRLYRGRNCMMGELGHVSINPNGPLCNCGNRGCMELYASDIGIIQRTREELANGQAPRIAQLCAGQPDKLDMKIILQAESEGDAVARAQLAYSLKYIALCIVTVIKTYDPDKIILGHTWLRDRPELFDEVLEAVFSNSLFARRNSIEIQVNAISNLELIAAGATVLEHQFSSTDRCRFLQLI